MEHTALWHVPHVIPTTEMGRGKKIYNNVINFDDNVEPITDVRAFEGMMITIL